MFAILVPGMGRDWFPKPDYKENMVVPQVGAEKKKRGSSLLINISLCGVSTTDGIRAAYNNAVQDFSEDLTIQKKLALNFARLMISVSYQGQGHVSNINARLLH